MAKPETSWPRRNRRWLQRAAGALAVLYALYLLAANGFLNTPLGVATINRKPERFSAQWGWAMSLYPGHIYARNVHLRGRGRTVEWHVAGSSAHGRIQLLPLLRRQLRFGTIHGGVVTVDVDTGHPPMPVAPRSGAAARRKAWELVFDGIRSQQVRSLRLGHWRVDGEGEAVFAFYKQIAGGPMEIPASEFHMRNATLRQGDALWADEATFDLSLAIARHTPAQFPSLRKLAVTRAHVKLEGDGPAMELREAKDGRLSLRRAGRGGRLSADLQLDQGAPSAGGWLHAKLPLAIVGANASAGNYALDARLDVLRDAMALHVQVPRRGHAGNGIDARLRVPGRALKADALPQLLSKAQGSVQLQWHFGSLAWLNPMLSKGWLRLDGAADVQADLNIVDGKLVDGSSASIPAADLHADVQDSRIQGRATAKAVVAGGRTTVDIASRQFSIAAIDAPTRPFVQGRDLQLQLVSGSALATFRDALQARLQFSNARIPDLRAYNRYLPNGSVSLLGGSGSLSGDLSLDAEGMPERASIRLSGTNAAIRSGVSRIVGDLVMDSRLHRLSGRAYALDMLRVGLDDVHLASAPADGPWWARLSLDGGRLQWQMPLHLDGTAHLQMKDVSILLAMFAERSAFPRWVGRLIDAGQVTATSRVRVDGRSVVLDGLQARNQRVDLAARLRLSNQQPTGDLYARWGVLGMGVELDKGRRKLHLAGAKRWYDSQPALIR